MKKVFFIAGLLLVMLSSCDNKPSLQKYFVEKSQTKNFVALDIAPNFVDTDSIKLSADEKAALQSLKKLNILIFENDSLNTQLYKTEQNNVKNLLKDEQYEELMRYGSNNEGVCIYAVGKDVHIDEFVLFMHRQDNGFGVVRLLGDDMNPNNIMTMMQLLQKGNLNLEQLEPLKDIMKK
ncbi:DUF4252 domain-containing protein [Flavobacterium salilacus subsp. salilacus]|uniref:DUF4252 domain-containing protein n=1 Tax=Flavobacterium TaxID=237 RepID=UPI00107558A3|nr:MULTISPECIES: DUF4252 domain-containing protein [Flavobacterium]KAF2518465.1 DUF4252 domain-containing protein [Flavobacterium salilacus subsp. salilacus]MBE1615104.1 DUF4252 domain-containing protein [Flavobacterium sp. SaA2.13]